MDHLVSATQFNVDQVMHVFEHAEQLRCERLPVLQDQIVCTAFYQRSTRTRLSFESAVLRLGGQVLTETHESSSAGKGETLGDSLRTMSQYCDLLVVSHPRLLHEAVKHSYVPVINTGDCAEHPTQALLDWFTIHEHLGRPDRFNLTVVGDLAQGRTVHSLMHIARLFGVKVNLVAMPGLELPRPYHTPNTVELTHESDIKQAMRETDIFYMTRLQTDQGSESSDYFELEQEHLRLLPQDALIMHPLPRCKELPEWVDTDPRAAYHTRQVTNGLYVRMAILSLMRSPQMLFSQEMASR